MILYRSPTVIINEFEWHVCVVKRNGHVLRRRYMWRPLSHKAQKWQPLERWPNDHKPKAIELAPLELFTAHAKRAERSEAERAQRLARLAA